MKSILCKECKSDNIQNVGGIHDPQYECVECGGTDIFEMEDAEDPSNSVCNEKEIKLKYYNIKVNLTEQDLYQLQSGEDFNWNWPTKENENVIIKMHLIKAEEDFGDEEEE